MKKKNDVRTLPCNELERYISASVLLSLSELRSGLHCTSVPSCRYSSPDSSRFTTRKMIQLRGIFRNASCHAGAAKHYLSLKNRPMVSCLIIIHKFYLGRSGKHSSM